MLIPILSIVISLISCIISALPIYRRRTDANPSQSEPRPPFSVSQYFERAEKAYLDTLEEQEPFKYEIVLWWGFDGIRLNRDGSTEWISRKQEQTTKQEITTTPTDNSFWDSQCNSKVPLFDVESICNSKARANAYDIYNVYMQNRLELQTQNLIQTLQSQQNTYIPYPAYVQQIQSCCCNFHNRTNV